MFSASQKAHSRKEKGLHICSDGGLSANTVILSSYKWLGFKNHVDMYCGKIISSFKCDSILLIYMLNVEV